MPVVERVVKTVFDSDMVYGSLVSIASQDMKLLFAVHSEKVCVGEDELFRQHDVRDLVDTPGSSPPRAQQLKGPSKSYERAYKVLGGGEMVLPRMSE